MRNGTLIVTADEAFDNYCTVSGNTGRPDNPIFHEGREVGLIVYQERGTHHRYLLSYTQGGSYVVRGDVLLVVDMRR